MNELLIITSYFPPETGAASNRIHHLAVGLAEHGYKTTVVAPLPNYPHGQIFDEYKSKEKRTEIIDGVTVKRLWIYASRSKNKFLRLFSMLSFSISLFRYFISNKAPKLVIVQSPPILVAYTALLCSRRKRRTLVLNISDLWPLAGLKLGAFKPGLTYKLLQRIERSNYKRPNLIMGQSMEILSHVSDIVPQKKKFLYRNFPEIHSTPVEVSSSSGDKIKLVYAGLLGVAQGIFELCKAIDLSNIEFHIYGTGPEKEDIEAFIASNKEQPITYHGELSRSDLHKTLVQYDMTIIPLLKRIYGSVPSKIFEYAKLGLPILYFGGGEGEDIVREHKLGWIAEAGDYKELNRVLQSISKSQLNAKFRSQIRTAAIDRFDFNKQLDGLIAVLSEPDQ